MRKVHLAGKIILPLLILALTYSLKGQTILIQGSVYNAETGESLPGVSIWAAGTYIGSTSDLNGHFQISIPQKHKILAASYVGFQKQKINTDTISGNVSIKLIPSGISLEEVVISTAKNQLSSFQQTTPVSIVKAQQIQDHSFQETANILSREPSVSMVGNAYHRSPSIRGLARKRVVMLIDGFRISSERNEGPPGTYVNPLLIRKIEVLRGPYSTLYGSDAIGGVINIMTKEYSKPLSNKYVGGNFSSNYQSVRNGYNANLLLNTQISDKLLFTLSAGKRKAGSFKDGDGNEVMGTNFSEESVLAKTEWQISKNHILKIDGMISLGDSIGKPAFNDSINALHPKDDHYVAGLHYQWKNIAPFLPQMNIRASFHRHEITARIYNYRTTIWGTVLNQSKNLHNNDWIYQHDFTFIINPQIKILAGFDFYERSGIHIDEYLRSWKWEPSSGGFHIGDLLYEGPKDTIINDSYQRSLGFFVQANYYFSEKLTFNAGLRWNKFETKAHLTKTTNIGPPYDHSLNEHETSKKSDDALSGNLGFSYQIDEKFSLTANIGQAFRVPSTKELFVNTMTPGGMNFCNPDLIPEKSLNLDLGLKFLDDASNSIALSLFHNKINDMIILEWDSLHASGTFNNKNASLYGAELCYDFRFLKNIGLNGSFSYVKGEENNGEPLMDIPPFQVNINMKYFLLKGKAYTGISGRFNAKQSKVATGDIPTGPFTVIDMMAGWDINKYFSFFASVSNLLNNTYREHYQFYWEHMPGRSFNAGINLNF